MALAIEDAMELNFSGNSTTTTTTTPEEDYTTCYYWNDWSPVIDWDAFPAAHDDFRGLIESIMENDEPHQIHEVFQDVSNSISTTSMMIDEEPEPEPGNEDLKGLRLVHLLMAAAEALTGANQSSELAQVILVRLKELVSPTNGTNMERLAAYFSQALQGLLEGSVGVQGKNYRDHHHQSDVVAAFQLFQDMSPYVNFGHFTANQAILEAVVEDKRVHIVDYDIMEGIQWASLMQALVTRKDSHPAPHLRITALTRNGNGRKSIRTVQETGRRLIDFAESIGQPFSFHQCRLDPDEAFGPSVLKLVKGEALVVNCMLHLPHISYRAPNSVASFLSGAKALNPKLVTLVEEEMGRTGEGGFVGRFMDSLHHYSAVYDSLEAGLPVQDRARVLVERVFLGPRIVGTVGRIYRGGGEEEGECSWGEWMGGAGFRPVGISYFNHCQAKLLLGVFNDGYRVELASNKLVLGWKSRGLLSASVWTPSYSNAELSTTSF
ncbi:hypothetical protein HHK36_030407 [Tetracentron sinense]|uniref:Nodulation signaling pathway 2-like protein n=1 Tax=Tetracentron sinense TaxID=13715 RepID=A0A835CYP4_TETSI|nr:hypothetical protein HHK36_030407 [Tetracentron sinense]